MIGTSDSKTDEKSVSRGTGAGSSRSLKRKCKVRRAGTMTRYATGSRSAKNTVTVSRASLSPALRMHAVSWEIKARLENELCEGIYPSAIDHRLRPMGCIFDLVPPVRKERLFRQWAP